MWWVYQLHTFRHRIPTEVLQLGLPRLAFQQVPVSTHCRLVTEAPVLSVSLCHDTPAPKLHSSLCCRFPSACSGRGSLGDPQNRYLNELSTLKGPLDTRVRERWARRFLSSHFKLWAKANWTAAELQEDEATLLNNNSERRRQRHSFPWSILLCIPSLVMAQSLRKAEKKCCRALQATEVATKNPPPPHSFHFSILKTRLLAFFSLSLPLFFSSSHSDLSPTSHRLHSNTLLTVCPGECIKMDKWAADNITFQLIRKHT